MARVVATSGHTSIGQTCSTIGRVICAARHCQSGLSAGLTTTDGKHAARPTPLPVRSRPDFAAVIGRSIMAAVCLRPVRIAISLSRDFSAIGLSYATATGACRLSGSVLFSVSQAASEAPAFISTAAVRASLTRIPNCTAYGHPHRGAAITGSVNCCVGLTVAAGIRPRLTFVDAVRNSNFGRASRASQGQKKGNHRSIFLL